MSDDHERDEPDRWRPSGNLAPVALGLGIAGLLLGLIPFYGLFFALPLSVVALVLGLTARGRPAESRGQAIGGAVTGAIGLLLVVGWAGYFAWGQLGFGSFASERVEVGVEEMVTADLDVAVPPSPGTSPDDAPGVQVAPGDPGRGLVTGLSGEAEVVIDGRTETMTLTDCALAEQSTGGVLVRGDGPEGRLVVARADGFSGLLLDVEIDGRPQGTFAGSVRGITGRGSGGGLVRDRRQFELDGQLRDLHSDEIADVSLTVTCS